MAIVKTIIMHQAFGYAWKQMYDYQGYVPEDTTWEEVLANFTKNGYGINNPWTLSLHRDGSPLGVRVYECKAAGEVLPLSDKNTPKEAAFVLCEVIHSDEKVIIFI